MRRGDYEVEGGFAAPRFSKVALAGISAGGLIVESEAVSYHDIDALIVVEFAEYAPQPFVVQDFGSGGSTCVTGGQPKRPGAPLGYAFVLTPSDAEKFFYDADPAVVHAVISLYERDPCGAIESVPAAYAVDLGAPTVRVPVLLVYADHSALLPGASIVELARFSAGGNPDVSTVTIPNAGHAVMLGRSAPHFRLVLSDWLKARGF